MAMPSKATCALTFTPNTTKMLAHKAVQYTRERSSKLRHVVSEAPRAVKSMRSTSLRRHQVTPEYVKWQTADGKKEGDPRKHRELSRNRKQEGRQGSQHLHVFSSVRPQQCFPLKTVREKSTQTWM